MKPQAIVFDFDGVLTSGGEDLKQEAWNYLVNTWSAGNVMMLNRARELWSEGKGSRYDILRDVFRGLSFNDTDLFTHLTKDAVEIMTNAYAECYNSIVQQLLEKSGMPDGTENVLIELQRVCPLFLNSATPEKNVKESVEKFHLVLYFKEVFGQPSSKLDNLQKVFASIARSTGFGVGPQAKQKIVFVGDGKNDLKAAREFGCRFIGIGNHHNNWKESPQDFPVVDSIRDVPQAIEAMPD